MINEEKFLRILRERLGKLLEEKKQETKHTTGHFGALMTLASMLVIKEFCHEILFPALEVIVKEINENNKNEVK